jgi:hypothetical protein
MAYDRSMIPQIVELLRAEMFDRAGGPVMADPRRPRVTVILAP